ncbi:hypothetical protein ABZ801_20880 [Actinomadura sp. NPDC047616]|uniref:hypothetical protein n=1 Tax=Actinomadura sp. NPDC047616 TaxID=3155914 RepID=UPI0033C647B9
MLYERGPHDARREHVPRTAAARPVQAVHVDRIATRHTGMRAGPVPTPAAEAPATGPAPAAGRVPLADGRRTGAGRR